MSEASEYKAKLEKLAKAGDYYAILGIPRGSDSAHANKALRKLGLKWHPDKNTSEEATAIFKLLTDARDNIINP